MGRAYAAIPRGLVPRTTEPARRGSGRQGAGGEVRRRCIVSAVRRIVVGVHGSLGSLQALRWAAEEARERHVPLMPVIAWVPPGGDMAERSHPSAYLRKLWADAASARLSAAFEEGLGGIPDDLCVRSLVARGETGPVLVDVCDRPGDLLVIGTGRRNAVGRALHRSVGRYCLAHATCPVIAVPPSALVAELRHGLLPWSRRHRRALEPIPGISHIHGE
jgi:nucleotide-binding universal stress UspA family protein